jgi:hypothetical protein
MKRAVPRNPATIQLHLPLLQAPVRNGAADPPSELILALIDLLLDAAHSGREDGGDDESEAHR